MKKGDTTKIDETKLTDEESEGETYEEESIPHTSLSHCEIFEDHTKKGCWFTQLCFITDNHLKEFHLNQPYCFLFTIIFFVLSMTLIEVLKFTWVSYHKEKREQIIREYEAEHIHLRQYEQLNRNKFSSVSGFLMWLFEKLKNGFMDGSLFTRTLQMYFPFLNGI